MNKILSPTQSRDNPGNLFMFMCFLSLSFLVTKHHAAPCRLSGALAEEAAHGIPHHIPPGGTAVGMPEATTSLELVETPPTPCAIRHIVQEKMSKVIFANWLCDYTPPVQNTEPLRAEKNTHTHTPQR